MSISWFHALRQRTRRARDQPRRQRQRALLGGSFQIAGAAGRKSADRVHGLCRPEPDSCQHGDNAGKFKLHVGQAPHRTGVEYPAIHTASTATPKSLMPFAGNPRVPMPKDLPFRVSDYLELVDWKRSHHPREQTRLHSRRCAGNP